ncbi:hypothetical protein DMENIID0001_094730 [Sergentomyia squamirostris]
MDRKLVLYQKAIEEERLYSEEISSSLREFTKNVADFIKEVTHQGQGESVSDEDLTKISYLTKSIHTKVKSLALAVEEDKKAAKLAESSRKVSKLTLPDETNPNLYQKTQKELKEVKMHMENSNKSFISMGCCLTELLDILTQEDSNIDLLAGKNDTQLRKYFLFLEKTLISFFNTVHDREQLPTNNYKFVCFAASVVGNLSTNENGRKILLNHEKNHFLLKTFLNLLCRLRFPTEIQLIEIFMKFLSDMSLEVAAVKIIQNHLSVMEQIIDYVNFPGRMHLQYLAIVILFNTLDENLSSGLFNRLSAKIDQISWGTLLNAPNETIRDAAHRLLQQIQTRKASQTREESQKFTVKP